ncbi:hypothetical protein [Streptomyces canus]|uniref:Uncharacterized protein n=1 Tax=Streptomyces canus TaxID=58343 RepID=A0AAW8FVD3_9ACTN|nr:hypothetical protein [Streptomyces canus]MDQ0758038.1 hypothetical protein [Streptomyces canus]MDQ0913215.1 hypothetical protein [Streptomyces canus]MDQ1073201.1 hypothetical protein [Streptomyces canus]
MRGPLGLDGARRHVRTVVAVTTALRPPASLSGGEGRPGIDRPDAVGRSPLSRSPIVSAHQDRTP